MAKRTNHVVRLSSGWSVRKSGAVKASKTFETKDKAIKFGREISKNEKTELYIHKENGMIQEKDSYGNDPNPPKDKN